MTDQVLSRDVREPSRVGEEGSPLFEVCNRVPAPRVRRATVNSSRLGGGAAAAGKGREGGRSRRRRRPIGEWDREKGKKDQRPESQGWDGKEGIREGAEVVMDERRRP